MATHSMYFQHRNDSKISTLIKARRLLLVKNCHAKGRELRGSFHSCGKLIVGHKNFFAVLLGASTSTFWFTLRYCARLINKKFVEEKIFTGTNFCELVFDRENHENFCLTKILHCTVTVVEVPGVSKLIPAHCFLLMLQVINDHLCLLWSCFLRDFSIDILAQDPSISR